MLVIEQALFFIITICKLKRHLLNMQAEVKMNQLCFNALHSQYKKGEIGRQDLEGVIFQQVITDHRRFPFRYFGCEERNDFVSWLYPRIHNAIDSYRDTGASFEAYVSSIIRTSAKEYRIRKIDKSIAEYTTWALRACEQYTSQEEPEYATGGNKPQAEVKLASKAKNPRQILILTLKCYRYVSDDFLDRIAIRIGIAKEELKKMTGKMHSIRAMRDEEARNMQERIYCQFYRCMVYEKKLSLIGDNKIAALKMQKRLEKARCRLEAMRKRLAGISPSASNSQIARVIGLSKGAVDASLHSLKTKWNAGQGNAILN